MLNTSASLLKRVQANDVQAWERFVELYTPLLLRWADRAELSADDARDLVQDLFLDLVRKLPKFRYDPERGKFRCWLATLFRHKRYEWWRKRHRHAAISPAALDELVVAPDDSFSEAEHERYLVRRALEVMDAEFEPTTRQACWEFIANDRPAKEVAAQLGISVNAVYVAKARVMRRVRQELGEFLD